jgi:predicted AAA+ superfamily ATPase
VQVCASLSDEGVRDRELSALWHALPELGLTSGTIVTLAEESLEKEGDLCVAVVPAWRFLLEWPAPLE